MPPASNAVSASSKFKLNQSSPSPDFEPTVPEPETQVTSGKKKKKNAANKQAQNSSYTDRISNAEVAREDTPPPSRPQTILSQIPRGFSLPPRVQSPLLDVEDEGEPTTEKISDQYTPPNDTWLEQGVYGKTPLLEPVARAIESRSPPVEPGFSTKPRYDSKSPPVSPPSRHARPVGYGAGIQPIPIHQRTSPSTYSYAPTAYGSPPAAHLPQQHFYNAQDVNLGFPLSVPPHFKEDPSMVRYTKLPPEYSTSRQGALLAYDSRVHIVRLESSIFDEIGMLDTLSGSVVDAAILEWQSGSDPYAAVKPLIACVTHGPKEVQVDQTSDDMQEAARTNMHQPLRPQGVEYTTKVEVYSMLTQERLAVLLETPSQLPQSAFRGASPTPPNPIGHLKLQVSGPFLMVASGVSGEVYAFTIRKDYQPSFACVGKFWTTIQPQMQRRDSSHHQLSDADISPADLGRASVNVDRAIASINGRWLAICPASSPSKPSLGAAIGCGVICGKNIGVDTNTAPTRPSLTCEVDSPDADTLLGKVARGVAQELVKGAKWLGDQGYQTWQSYWRKDQSPSLSATQPAYSPPVYGAAYTPNAFPPTHGEMSRASQEPELVAIYDLEALCEGASRKPFDDPKPLATFQPPRGCSFLSFAPHGLNLLTAGRKGDVQYLWDLMQIKTCRTLVMPVDDDKIRGQPCVRQIAKYERLSGSVIVDVVWDTPAGTRFAVLTKNKTVHLFDLPLNAFRWPPPRTSKKLRPTSRSIDSTQHDMPGSSGFFASAKNIANQAQPIISNWRGRAPSMGGGLAGIGQTGIGLASATGARGGKVVAAGLSKSLGAASETVNQIRHAGESRLHLRSTKEPLPGRIFWIQQGRKSILAVLEADAVKKYHVRRSNNHEKRERDSSTVFAARKGIVVKLPGLSRSAGDAPIMPERRQPGSAEAKRSLGFWKLNYTLGSSKKISAHPLSFAEIETNAPYQPFHSDRRVTLSVYSDASSMSGSRLPIASLPVSEQPKTKAVRHPKRSNAWAFGDDIAATTLNISKIRVPDDENDHTGSVIYRETVKVTSPTAGEEEMDQIVSTTRRRKVKKDQSSLHGNGSDGEKDDGFFEDDCDVLDFATDRV